MQSFLKRIFLLAKPKFDKLEARPLRQNNWHANGNSSGPRVFLGITFLPPSMNIKLAQLNEFLIRFLGKLIFVNVRVDFIS